MGPTPPGCPPVTGPLPGRGERKGGIWGWGHTDLPALMLCPCRDSMDSVKQSAALCLLRLYKASPDLVPMGEWTARVVHLLNDQHMVRPLPSTLRPWAATCKAYPLWANRSFGPLVSTWVPGSFASVPPFSQAPRESGPISPVLITHPAVQKPPPSSLTPTWQPRDPVQRSQHPSPTQPPEKSQPLSETQRCSQCLSVAQPAQEMPTLSPPQHSRSLHHCHLCDHALLLTPVGPLGHSTHPGQCRLWLPVLNHPP